MVSLFQIAWKNGKTCTSTDLVSNFPRSIETYGKKKVIVVEKKRDDIGIPFPAITISVWEQDKPYECRNLTKSIEKCIEENSLSVSDLLKGIWLGYGRRLPLNVTKDIFTEECFCCSCSQKQLFCIHSHLTYLCSWAPCQSSGHTFSPS